VKEHQLTLELATFSSLFQMKLNEIVSLSFFSTALWSGFETKILSDHRLKYFLASHELRQKRRLRKPSSEEEVLKRRGGKPPRSSIASSRRKGADQSCTLNCLHSNYDAGMDTRYRPPQKKVRSW
jgi:hypothetical protein